MTSAAPWFMSSLIRFDRLSCGIPACIQTSDESKLLSISVWINAGSARDPVDKGGLAHLCEHLLLRPLACTNSRAQRIQAEAGALVSACTDPEWVVITAQAPVEQSTSLIELLSALVREPYCEPDGMEAERRMILRELSDEKGSPAEVLAGAFRKSAFSEHPWAQPVGGTPATLAAIEPSDAQGYYTRFLNASNMLVTAHGESGVCDLTATLDEAFKGLPEAPVSSDFAGDESATTAQSPPAYRAVRIQREMSKTGSDYGVLAGLGSVPRGTEQYWTALAFEVLMADGPGCLLTQWLRNERLWIHGAASMTEAFSNWGCQYFLMRVSGDQVDEVIEHLGERWRAMPEWVTDERMEALRKRLLSRALSSLARLQDRMTLMRDTVLAETGESGTLEGGLEAIVGRHAREWSSGGLLTYIRQ